MFSSLRQLLAPALLLSALQSAVHAQSVVGCAGNARADGISGEFRDKVAGFAQIP